MKNKLIASVVLAVSGVLFLVAAFQFAPLVHAAPGAGQSGPTILEFVYGLPAIAFDVAGVAGILVGVVFSCYALVDK